MTSTALQLRQDTNANIAASTGLVQGEIAFDVTRNAIVVGSSGGAGGMHWVTPFTGTWTPTIFGASSAGSQTYSAQVGTYVKIGVMVFAQCRMTLTSNSGSSGAATIGGLPFAPTTAASSYWPLGIGFIDGVAHATSYNQFSGVVSISTAKQALLLENGSNIVHASVQMNNVSSAADMGLTFIYQAASDST